jgi:hypothetical protein
MGSSWAPRGLLVRGSERLGSASLVYMYILTVCASLASLFSQSELIQKPEFQHILR